MTNSEFTREIELADAAATEALGRALGTLAEPPFVITLSGDLGAGKTTLARGYLRARGYSGAVKSPTFTLVESYAFDAGRLHHFDLYRIADPGELDFIGFEEYFAPDSEVLIEWPAHGADRVPPADVAVEMTVAGLARRARLTWSGSGPAERLDRLLNS